MYQNLVKAVQVVVFSFAIWWCWQNQGNLGFSTAGATVLGVFLVTIVTVIPWLIAKMFQQAYGDIRAYRARRSGTQLASQPSLNALEPRDARAAVSDGGSLRLGE